ncbi:MAG TPA: glycosyltransferase [Rhodocyclaceae bacterium]|nr:glycosyltransferase [Rhodocyclaceae bacterium]
MTIAGVDKVRERISVIMPCFNAETFVAEAVDSVLGQTYPNIELIVVDDGSTDGSREILAAYGDRITVIPQSNSGPYHARNLGLRHASGAYVAFLDADDWWRRDFVETMHVALETRPDCALAYCGWQNVGARDRSNEPFIPRDYETADKLELMLGGGSPWPIHAALVRRAAIDAIGGFREDLATSLDFELWLRLCVGRRIVRVPEVLAFYRFHGEAQISAQPWRQAINGWRIKRRFVDEHPEHVTTPGVDAARRLADGVLLKRGYEFFWRRDLVSAQRIFRRSLFVGGWRPQDLRFLLPSLLPASVFRWLVVNRDA